MNHKKGIVVSAACASLLLSTPAVVANATEAADQAPVTSAAAAQADENGFVIEDGVLTEYTGSATEVVIPEGVTEIAEEVFAGRTDVTSVSFPSTLVAIGDRAFSRCESIKSVALPEGLTTLGAYAFESIPELEYVFIPKTLAEDSGWGAFSVSKSSVEDKELMVEFADGTARIADGLFYEAYSLKNVDIPDSVTKIGDNSFYNSGLKSISMPESIEVIGDRSFMGCSSLSTITIGSRAEACIGTAFPSSLKSIGEYASFGCSNITELILPEGIETLSSEAFGNIPKLKTVYIPGSIQTAVHPFSLNDDLVGEDTSLEVIFSDEVEKLPDFIFDGACSLKHINIPNTVKEIGDYAFRFSGVEELTLPDSVTRIGAYAFCFCDSLSSIYIPSSVIEIEEHAFVDAGGEGEDAFFIRCPSGSYAESYAKEYEIPYVTDDEHHHSFGAWQVYSEADCDSACVERRYCSCGAYEERTVGDQLGHAYGDWVVEAEPTYNTEGSQYRECSRCHDRETQVLPKLEFNPDENPGYSQATFKVVDAESLEAVVAATITITNDAGNAYTATTDSGGLATIIAPAGTYDVLIEKKGYQLRGFERRLEEGSVTLPDIGLATESFAKGSLSVERMTQEEIEEAGIDTSSIGNNHVYRYEVTLKFDDGLEIPAVSYKTGDGKILGGFLGNSSNKTNGGSGEYKHKDDNGITTRICQVNEYFYLVIRGEAKWQKEMFHVQLLVVNSSQTDKIVNATAELKLPEGLSLAEMTGAQQSANVAVGNGTIDCGEQASVDWYVRGDTEGDYTLEADLSGQLSTFMDSFTYTYKTLEPIRVYAGTDMKLTVRASDSAAYLEPYTMFFELENISDHSIYNVTHEVQNVSQYEVTKYTWVEDGTVVDSMEVWNQLSSDDLGPDGRITAEEFKPGEKLVVMVTTNILWKSPLQTLKDNISFASDLGTLVGIATGTGVNPLSLASSIMSYVDVRYFLTGAVVSTLEGSTAEIPTSFSISHDPSMRLVDKLVEKLIDKGEEGVAHLILNIMGLGGSADEIYDVSKVIGEQKHDLIEVATTTSDSKAHAWIEAVSGEDVLGLSLGEGAASRDLTTPSKDVPLAFTGGTELVVTGKSAGVADVVVEDEDGNRARKRYYVREAMPGQDNLISDANDLYGLGFIPLPAGTLYSQNDADLYDYFGYELVVNGGTPAVGSVIPTGASLREKDGSFEVPIVVLGDVTSDGSVDERDIEVLLAASSGSSTLSGAQKSAGDLTGDDVIDQADVDALREFLNMGDVDDPDPGTDPDDSSNPDPDDPGSDPEPEDPSTDPEPTPMPTPGTGSDDESVTNPDGTITTTETAEDGTVAQVTTDEEGTVVSVDVEISEDAAESGSVTLPIDGVVPTVEDDAPEISVVAPDDASVIVTIPLSSEGAGDVDTSGAVLATVGPDGSVTVLPKTVRTDEGLAVAIKGNVVLKVIDAAISFPDVDGSEWYASEVVPFISSRGIITGAYRDGVAYFDASERVTRGSFATMLHRLELTLTAQGCTFTDVAPGAWYEAAVSWCQEQGIIQGYDSAHYGPEDNLLREQLAVLLMRYADWLGLDISARADLSAFPDAAEVSPYATDAMSWAVAEGLIRGDCGELRPTGDASRAEAAVVLMRFVELLYK